MPFSDFFDTTAFMPHGHCFLWRTDLLFLHVLSDLLTTVAYFSIPLSILYFMRLRRDRAYDQVAWLFIGFISFCGLTHFLGVIALWFPIYGVTSLAKAGTAGVSVMTALVLWPLVPRLANLPSPGALRQAEARLGKRQQQLAQTEARLHEADDRFQAAFQTAPHGMALVALDGTFIEVNPAFCNIVGQASDDLKSRTSMDITHADDIEPDLEQVDALRRGDIPSYVMEKRYVRPDGTFVPVFLSVGLVRDSTHTPLYLVKQILDLSMLKETQEQLAQSRRLDALGQLSAGIAHDFNNLLSIILGNLELVQRRLPAAKPIDSLITVAHDATRRASGLVSRILTFGGRQTIEPEPVDVMHVVHGMKDLLTRTIREDIVLDMALADDLPPVECDRGALETAIINTVVNAEDAIEKEGRIAITVEEAIVTNTASIDSPHAQNGRYILIAIADTGSGMTEEIRAKAIEPFYTTKETGAGTGLGLSQVYGTLRQAGGFMTIESTLGAGTTIRLYLPARPDLAAEDVPHIAPESGGDAPARLKGHGEKILVVEDQAAVRQTTVAMLEELNYVCATSSSADEAFEILEQDMSIELVLSDVVMPGRKSGLDLRDLMRTRRPDLPFLLASGHSSRADREAIGGERPKLLRKPVTLDMLAEAVRDALHPSAV